MKLDYDYIKAIIEALESYPSHLFWSKSLAEQIGSDLKDKAQMDKFCGHILLLADDGYIDSFSADYGISRTCDGFSVYGADLRLTSRGYEFLDILREDTIFRKIKKFSLSTAFEIGKSALTEVAKGIVTI